MTSVLDRDEDDMVASGVRGDEHMTEFGKGEAMMMSPPAKPYRFDLPTRTNQERGFLERLEEVAQQSQTSFVEKITNAAIWMPRQNLARLIVQWEIFKRVLNVQGSIVECGVCFGGGFGAWGHFLSIADPFAHHRRVIGFDTFSGFPGMSEADAKAKSGLAYTGGMAAPVDEELKELASIHDLNRPVGHVPRLELVKGDACETIPRYVQDHPELVISLLTLDFDIAEPTRVALESFVPRMPKGAVICWDELGVADWPGETQATINHFGNLNGLRIERLPWASTICFAEIG